MGCFFPTFPYFPTKIKMVHIQGSMHNTNRHAPPIRFKSGGDDDVSLLSLYFGKTEKEKERKKNSRKRKKNRKRTEKKKTGAPGLVVGWSVGKKWSIWYYVVQFRSVGTCGTSVASCLPVREKATDRCGSAGGRVEEGRV